MTKNWGFIKVAIIVCPLLLSSCASVSQEAVSLNEEVGISIAATYSAYINLLNYYFAQRRARIDETMDRYRERLIENIKSQLPPGHNEIPIDKMEEILSGLTARRDSLHEELEKTRILLMNQIMEDHLMIIQANANITALLRSKADVEKGMRTLSSKLSQTVGYDLKLEEISELLDAQLEEAGNVAGKMTGTYEKIQALFPNKKE